MNGQSLIIPQTYDPDTGENIGNGCLDCCDDCSAAYDKLATIVVTFSGITATCDGGQKVVTAVNGAFTLSRVTGFYEWSVTITNGATIRTFANSNCTGSFTDATADVQVYVVCQANSYLSMYFKVGAAFVFSCNVCAPFGATPVANQGGAYGSGGTGTITL
jgi:hypothetical protein